MGVKRAYRRLVALRRGAELEEQKKTYEADWTVMDSSPQHLLVLRRVARSGNGLTDWSNSPEGKASFSDFLCYAASSHDSGRFRLRGRVTLILPSCLHDRAGRDCGLCSVLTTERFKDTNNAGRGESFRPPF
jgi:hypothetical protein